jgi:hypothetical protein
MQIPKNIKIGGIRYTVKVVDTEHIDNKAAGEINTEKCTMKILKGNQHFMNVTFLHEIIHAINMELAEETVEFLAQSLYQVVSDNPKIFEGGVKYESSNK